MRDFAECAPKTQEVSPVEKAIKQIEHANESLNRVITALASRLSPILRNEPAAPTAANEARNPMSVPLAETLALEADRISWSVSCIEDLISRLAI